MDSQPAIDPKLAAALVGFQAELTPVSKTAANPFFKSSYAPLPEVMESIQPLLAKHKLAVVQLMTHLDGQSALKTIVLHEAGGSLKAVTPLLLSKQDAQSQGSAVTYARRYGVMAALGIVADEDDDGNAASTPRQRQEAPQSAPRASNANPPSEKQLGMIRALSKELGIAPEIYEQRIMLLDTSAKASEAIDKLQDAKAKKEEEL